MKDIQKYAVPFIAGVVLGALGYWAYETYIKDKKEGNK